MNIIIREASPKDFTKIEKILLSNKMLKCPDIDGKKAMQRVYERMGKYFLVAEEGSNNVVGMIRGCYDGSRALIHQMAVDPKYQKKGIGKKLLGSIALRFMRDGAPSVSVTATKHSKEYYKKMGFEDYEVTLLVLSDIKTL